MPPGQGNLVGIFGPGGFVADTHAPLAKRPAPPALPPEMEFGDILRAAGFQVTQVRANTSKVQRCPDAQDKPNGDTGWYRLWTTGKRPAGAYGTWRIDGYTSWAQGASNGDNRLSFEEQLELDAEILAERRRRAEMRDETHAAAAQAAASHLAGGVAADNFPYLARKQVRAHAGLVQRDDMLLIPRQDVDGVLWSYHSISADGATKKHQRGGRVSGTFFPIGLLDGADLICLTEGYATAATVHEASGWTTLACLDAGNIVKVAAAVCGAFPAARLVVAVDDDHEKAPNTGRSVGEKCTAQFAATVATPPNLLAGESDWNDLGARIGRDAVRTLLLKALGEEEAPFIDAAGAMGRTPAALDWVVAPYIVRSYVNFCAADGGSGKTTIFQMLATSMATGKPWLGCVVNAGPALLVLGEDDEDAVLRRQIEIDRYLSRGVEALQFRHPLHIMARLGSTSFLARRSRDGAWTTTDFYRQLCRRLEATPYHLVVFDSLADIFPENENDRACVSEFVTLTLAHLAREYRCAVLVLSHTPKAQGSNGAASYSGSTAWNAKSKSRLLLERDSDLKTHLTLSLEKSNFAATGERLDLRQFAGIIVPADELPMLAGPDSPLPEADQSEAVEDAFMSILRKGVEHGQRFSTLVNANNYAPRAFVKEQRRLGYKFTATQYSDAMHALMDARRIANEAYQGRHHRLVPVAAGDPWREGSADA